ncbi:thioredoxin [Limnochorda pilosa]|uniref:Thioredoxin n=1 Tax=Limnochorda pilosa TaxID=1555112 RepID=A0A0K2SMY5_LIMPI|nr:thioredoxin [Limnochorda pilosa]BAS28367.1 thioredoxin [Limnochorda pilosa]
MAQDGLLLHVSDGDFEEQVLRSDLPVLVDFWADWCMPCRAIAPVVERMAQEYAGRLRVAKLDVDANPEIAARYGVMSIPTLLLFRGGQEVHRHVGSRVQGLREQVEAHLG